MLYSACTMLKFWMSSWYKIQIFYIKSRKFASLGKFKGWTVLAPHGPMVTIGWCWVATVPYNGVFITQLAALPTSPNCLLPDSVIHLHDLWDHLWAHKFMIPDINTFFQEIFVSTKFTVKVQMWMNPPYRLPTIQSFLSLAKSHLWSSASLAIG